eukprot:1581674-Pyramimonas_sp.AAC.1
MEPAPRRNLCQSSGAQERPAQRPPQPRTASRSCAQLHASAERPRAQQRQPPKGHQIAERKLH